MVLPATASDKTAYVTPLAAAHSPFVAPATAFISHAYDDEFLGVLDAVAALEAREGSSAFYYFDLLVVNQHGQDAIVPFEVLRDEFGRSVRAIGRTLLVLRWANPIPLQRAWCVFEMATTLAMGASMKVLMSPVDTAVFKETLRSGFDSLTYKTCRVDVEKASAREKADEDNIKRVIREAGGYLETNQLVIEAIKSWMVEEGREAVASEAGEIENARVTHNLANLLSDQGKLGEAKLLFVKALAVFRRMLGKTHPDTQRAISNLANLLVDQGALSEAEPLFFEALAARKRTFGGEHPITLNSISNLANMLSKQGKLLEAMPLCLGALAAFRRILGNEHPSTLASINSLALLQSESGNLVLSEDLYLEGLSPSRRVLGDTHPLTYLFVVGLATCLRRQGRLDEALLLAKEAHAGRCAHLGEHHPDTLYSIHELGVLLRLLGSAVRATPHARAAYACRLELQGATSRLTLASQLSLAHLEGNVALAVRIKEAGIQE